MQQKWKANGPLPESRNEDLWPRFRSACDAAFEALKPWFEQRDAERLANVAVREQLIERLSVVADDGETIGLAGSAASKDHEKRRFEQVQELQKTWKESGPVAPETRREMDKRWKALLDNFYGKRRQARAQQEAEYQANVPLRRPCSNTSTPASATPKHRKLGCFPAVFWTRFWPNCVKPAATGAAWAMYPNRR